MKTLDIIYWIVVIAFFLIAIYVLAKGI